MKRSHVVTIIAESLVEPRHDDVFEEASYILKRLERLGMAPPFCEAIYMKTHSDGGNGHEWESEDDT